MAWVKTDNGATGATGAAGDVVVTVVVVGIDQLVGVDDKVTHQRIVDRRLCLGTPGAYGLGMVGIGANELDRLQILESRAVEVGQFTANNDVQKLVRFHNTLA